MSNDPMVQITNDIRQNLTIINARIDVAARESGRTRSDIRLVVVTKNRTPDTISAAIAAGATDLGENRVQELMAKKPFVEGEAVWHFIGALQRNKVKQVVGRVDLIQSIDRLELGIEVDRWAARVGLVQSILIQVNVSGEATKQGVALDSLEKLVAELDKLRHIRVEGLMTIAPAASDSEQARPIFAKLREAHDRLASRSSLKWLSMGMTDDFAVAVEEGSNMVRIGRAVFAGT